MRFTYTFTTGKLLTTPGALAACRAVGKEPTEFFLRHASGDYGKPAPGGWLQNEENIRAKGAITSVYPLRKGCTLLVITVRDHTHTALILVHECKKGRAVRFLPAPVPAEYRTERRAAE